MSCPPAPAQDEFYLAFLRDVAALQEQVLGRALGSALRKVESPKLWHLLALIGHDVVDLEAYPALGLLRIGELLGRTDQGPTINELLAAHGLPTDCPWDAAQDRPELLDQAI